MVTNQAPHTKYCRNIMMESLDLTEGMGYRAEG
jgi:hypothetical protein